MSAHSLSSVAKVTPQVICGALHQQNKTALDWSWQGPLAFGCNNYIVIVDHHTSQNVQTLDGHSANVIKVRWCPQRYHSSIGSPYALRLASVDGNGQCILWDVGQCTHISNFSIGFTALVDMQWLTLNDGYRDMLAILTSPDTMTVWNADSGTKISRFTFSETITAFAFNPFSPDQLILLSSDCFIFVNEFNPTKNPSSKKLYMNLPQQQIGGSGRGWSRDAPRRLLSGENLKSEESLSLVDCIQIGFSSVERDYLYLLYSREILIIDVQIMQAVGSVYLERGSTPFIQIYLCQQRDAIYCLHENGSISFRVRQSLCFPRHLSLTQSDFRDLIDVVYDLHYQSEPQRISKSIKPHIFAVYPSTELKMAVLTSEGRILFWETLFENVGLLGERVNEEEGLLTLISALPAKSDDERIVGETCNGLTLSDCIAPHWFSPSDGPDTYLLMTVSLLMTGMYYGLASSLNTLKMCPPLTTKNLTYYKPLLAIGNGSGGIQIYNLSTHQMHLEITVHTCPVRGIEWITHNSLLSYAYPPANSNGLVRNELSVVNLNTGYTIQLKKGDTQYQPPITAVKLSPHRNYFVVNYKDSPPEFYNAKNHTLIRKFEAKPAVFPVVEWANVNAFPSFLAKSRHRVMSPDLMENEIEAQVLSQDKKSQSHSTEKEILTLVDTFGNLHHITVDKGGFQIGPRPSKSVMLQFPLMRSVNGIGWKAESILVGDNEGVLTLWDVISGKVSYIETPKANIKKIKFGPGKGNKRTLILYHNRIDIRDVYEDILLGQYKWSKGETSIDDADWCSSDKLVCLFSDGNVKVTDVKFIYSTSTYSSTTYHEPVFSPYIMLPHSTFRFKYILQHQPWRVEYSLDYSDLDEMDPIEKGLATLLESLPSIFREKLMTCPLGVPQRCLLTAILFGDEREVEFWRVALYHMTREKKRLQDPRYRRYKFSSSPSNPESDVFQPDSNASTSVASSLRQSLEDLLNEEEPVVAETTDELAEDANIKTWRDTPPLDLSFDLFMDQDIYKRYQLYRIMCHDGRRHTTAQTRRCAETLLFLGQTDRAVQLLLETDSSCDEYYTDALKACLAATIRSSGASQSTIKLVATNLIANNRLTDGAQLLSLIDKGLDACRYLQTYGEWYLSIWLAKSTLNEKESHEVFLRWVDNLTSPLVNQKTKGVLVLISMGQYYKALELLYSMRFFDLAAVFAESCLEYGLIRRNKDTSSLIEAVFLEYARLLEVLGMRRAMRYYCNLAGENGQLLLEEHLSPQGKVS